VKSERPSSVLTNTGRSAGEDLESAEFNSLEIMRVASEDSRRFLGVSYVTVSAQSRDNQESAPLSLGQGPSGEGPRAMPPLEPKHKAARGNESRQEDNDHTD